MALKPDSPLWNYFDNIVELGMAECKFCKHRLRNNRSFNLKQHLRKVHKESRQVWQHFVNYADEGIAVCKMCYKRMKNRSGIIRLHLRNTHNIELKKTAYDLNMEPFDEERIQDVLKIAKRNMAPKKKEGSFIKINKIVLVRSVLGFLVEDRMSLTTIGSKNMQSILKPLCEAVAVEEGKEFKLNKEEIECQLGVVANLMRQEFLNELHWRLLSLRIETDLSASSTTFCLSVMFVDKSQIQKRLLGVIELENNAELTEGHIKDILHKFNIDSNQIISAYWDNTKGNYHKYVSNTEYLNEIQNFEKYPDLKVGEIKVQNFIGTIAHQCVLDVLKDPRIFKQFLECRNFVKFLSDENNGYFELFEKNSLTMPQLDSPWQWGSTHKMIQNLFSARSVLQNVKFENYENSDITSDVNNNMWSFIEAFSKAFNIIQKSILKFYTEELNFGDFYAQWLKCRLLTQKFLMAEMEIDSSSYMILAELLKCIEQRSHQVVSQDFYLACLYMDPRFQHTLDLTQTSIASEYLKKIWGLAGLYNFELVGNESKNQEDKLTNEINMEDEDAFLNEYLSQDIKIKDTKIANIYRKIEGLKLSFQMVETNILRFWKTQQQSEPVMHTLSSICFAIPATQNYCKQIYGDFYKSDRDEELSKFTKENLLFVRLNAEHLSKAVENLKLSKDEGSDTSFSCESESEDVVLVDENSNAASTSTAHSTGDIVGSNTAIVHPMTSVENTLDASSVLYIIKE